MRYRSVSDPGRGRVHRSHTPHGIDAISMGAARIAR
jgi:hypothetical protein